MSSKILVCGGTGLVGGNLVKKLIEKNHTEIHATYHSKKPANSNKVIWHRVDLRRQEETERLFNELRPDHVYLASAKVGGILANNTYKAEFIYDNISIATNVIHSAYQFGVKKLLNLGSSCIYPRHAPQPMKEEHLLTGLLEQTNEPYAIAKISAIKLVRYYNEQYGTNFFSVMPTNLYGPGDNFNLETSHVLPSLIRKFHIAKLLSLKDMKGVHDDLKKYPIGFGFDKEVDFSNEKSFENILSRIGITGDFVTLWGSGNVYREFLFIEDLASACIYLMEKFNASDIKNLSPDYFVNIGTGEDITIKELALLIKQITGFKGEIKFDSSKPDGTPKKLLNITKIKQLGWHPKTTLEEGIKKTYEWYLK